MNRPQTVACRFFPAAASFRRVVLSGLAGASMTLVAGTASAQAERPARVENGARFGAWTVVCEAIAVNETLCVLTQRLVSGEGQTFLTELLAFNDADEQQAYIAARVPLGAYFPAGYSMRRESEETALDFDWQSCTAEICEALLVIDAATLQTLEGDGNVLAGYVPSPGASPLVFRVSTEGLGDGLTALAGALGQPGIARVAPETGD